MMRRAACKAANPLKIRASLGHDAPLFARVFAESQSLKDQGKSRTGTVGKTRLGLSRNPLKIRASLGHHLHPAKGRGGQSQSLKDQGKSRTITMDDIEDYFGESQSLKDQGKSRTLDSLAFARRQSFSLRKH